MGMWEPDFVAELTASARPQLHAPFQQQHWDGPDASIMACDNVPDLYHLLDKEAGPGWLSAENLTTVLSRALQFSYEDPEGVWGLLNGPLGDLVRAQLHKMPPALPPKLLGLLTTFPESTYTQLTDVLLGHVEKTAWQLNPRSIAEATHAVAKLGRFESPALARLELALRSHLPHLSVDELSNAVGAVALLGPSYDHWLSALLAEAGLLLEELEPPHVTKILSALGQARIQDKPIVDALISKAVSNLWMFDPATLSDLLASFHGLGLALSPALPEVLLEASCQMQQYAPDDIVRTAASLAAMGMWEPNFVAELTASARPQLHLFEPQQLLQLTRVVCTWPQHDEPILEDLLDQILLQLDSFPPYELVSLLHALAPLNPAPDDPLLVSILQALAGTFEMAKPSSLCAAARAIAAHGGAMPHETVLQEIVDVSLAKAQRFSAEEALLLAQCLDSLGHASADQFKQLSSSSPETPSQANLYGPAFARPQRASYPPTVAPSQSESSRLPPSAPSDATSYVASRAASRTSTELEQTRDSSPDAGPSKAPPSSAPASVPWTDPPQPTPHFKGLAEQLFSAPASIDAPPSASNASVPHLGSVSSAGSTPKYTGVKKYDSVNDKRGKWVMMFRVRGANLHLPKELHHIDLFTAIYNTPELAAKAYDRLSYAVGRGVFNFPMRAEEMEELSNMSLVEVVTDLGCKIQEQPASSGPSNRGPRASSSPPTTMSSAPPSATSPSGSSTTATSAPEASTSAATSAPPSATLPSGSSTASIHNQPTSEMLLEASSQMQQYTPDEIVRTAASLATMGMWEPNFVAELTASARPQLHLFKPQQLLQLTRVLSTWPLHDDPILEDLADQILLQLDSFPPYELVSLLVALAPLNPAPDDPLLVSILQALVGTFESAKPSSLCAASRAIAAHGGATPHKAVLQEIVDVSLAKAQRLSAEEALLLAQCLDSLGHASADQFKQLGSAKLSSSSSETHSQATLHPPAIDTLADALTDLGAYIREKPTLLADILTDLGSSIREKPTLLADLLTDLGASIREQPTSLTDILTDLGSSIRNQPTSSSNFLNRWMGQVTLHKMEKATLPPSWTSKQKARKKLVTNTYATELEAARAVDRILYCLGRMNFNFPLSESDKADLDKLGLDGVLSQFRSVGRKREGVLRYIRQRNQRWSGFVTLSTSEIAKLPTSFQSKGSLHTPWYSSDVQAAKAVNRVLYSLGRKDDLNFPLTEDEQRELDGQDLEAVMAGLLPDISPKQSSSSAPEASTSAATSANTSPSAFISVYRQRDRWIGHVTLHKMERATLPPSWTSKQKARKKLVTNTYATELEAARAVDRILYCLGRMNLNFPLSESDKADLDKLGLDGVLSQFRSVGRKREGVLSSDVQAAKAVNRVLYSLGRKDDLNFPLTEDEQGELDGQDLEAVMAGLLPDISPKQPSSSAPEASSSAPEAST
eukprot:gene16152-22312_t